MTALLRAVSGLILWAVAFSTLYALQGVVCALGWDRVQVFSTSAGRLSLLLLYAVWVAILVGLCWHFYVQLSQRGLLVRLALGCAIVGLTSTIVTGMPVLTTTLCY